MTRHEYQEMSEGYSPPPAAGFTVAHSPHGFAYNMGWAVLNRAGTEVYRGPEWSARANARVRNAGTYVDREVRQAEAMADMLRAIVGSR